MGLLSPFLLHRLDIWHAGLRRYIDNKLTLAPLERPKRILDLGSGSCAWLIEAAEVYADAELVAVDADPPPARPLPRNLRYEQRNILDPFPPSWIASFDVVHCRFILCHLPNVQAILPRVIALLRPGGWLLADDADCRSVVENAPAVGQCMSLYINSMLARGQDPHIGASLAQLLQATDQFDEVNTRTACIPVNPAAVHDPKLKMLTETMLRAYTYAIQYTLPKTIYALTPELRRQWREETARTSEDWRCNQLFTWTWSRKRF
ncbi:S-adenosyl-L-methionine-dependent methyltransferase [Vararia minispora EC-137]|uniref:S-adenosyl-L-methionine-dependent methyltransferase n=1 Tax=Vararia minispora EC-137 TaxID=1314806 RepID=A0ACB8QXG3_9AGAM|nr:S-adenosyl-L-methionine-dependent methyltransferase [Vararia minispora EC-137]